MTKQLNCLSHWFRKDKETLVDNTRCSCETLQLYNDNTESISVSELKERANALYKQKRLLEAEQVYMIAITQIEDERRVPITNTKPPFQEEKRSTLQALYSNLAQTRLILEKFQEAERDAKKAIDLHQKGTCSTKVLVKSLLRRSSAFLNLLQLDSALASLEQVRKLEPNNPECHRLYSLVTQALVDQGTEASSNYEQKNQRRHILDSPQSLLFAVRTDKQPNEYLSSQISKTYSKPCALIQELCFEEGNLNNNKE
ncbi:hypothetical protein Gasu2_43170 [Galdieria sulphuraria]|uniref:peptidylprolyl isomerase n=1 Tax=Galdieria sulphuraria TaxID=130081 RepID=M2XVL8_GALSU|nr:uncharacterized protein Gasu_46880 [Galdieria sulphuraria]EME27698.1 hypothetical protein Gasu_46880 [Galdieria sulphuraria]GJD10103.1 hypothetical protein Gasu2_43170 [Galdieria sulphuraria]|eukprot:XP_005704218.1 hypothetical protein Gasu_46880 [Galdieria sulphuraria]